MHWNVPSIDGKFNILLQQCITKKDVLITLYNFYCSVMGYLQIPLIKSKVWWAEVVPWPTTLTVTGTGWTGLHPGLPRNRPVHLRLYTAYSLVQHANQTDHDKAEHIHNKVFHDTMYQFCCFLPIVPVPFSPCFYKVCE